MLIYYLYSVVEFLLVLFPSWPVTASSWPLSHPLTTRDTITELTSPSPTNILLVFCIVLP